MARLGESLRATAEVERLLLRGEGAAGFFYNAARVFALAAGKHRDAISVEPYAERAVHLLRQAVARGFKDAAHMNKDTDLDALRQRHDFQELLAGLEKK